MATQLTIDGTIIYRTLYAIVLHVREETVRIWVVQRTMLAEILLVVSALNSVPEQRAASADERS